MNLIPPQRCGARRKADIPPEVLAELSAGTYETANLMEWLAADMQILLRTVARETQSDVLRESLLAISNSINDETITGKLTLAGRTIAQCFPKILTDGHFNLISDHRSDLVRQWACYAINDPATALSLADRLGATLKFAQDKNMSVRETAWMSFRPYVLLKLEEVIGLLHELASDKNANVRRFCVEVTRPRSVWGAHIHALKANPNLALPLLEQVRDDPARYVQLAVGNWLNDASKTRPDWVAAICSTWNKSGSKNTLAITRRGLRTISKNQALLKANTGNSQC